MLGAAHHVSHEKKHTGDEESTFLQTRLCRGEEEVWRERNQDGQERGCARFIPSLMLVSHPASGSSFTAYHSLPNRMEVVLRGFPDGTAVRESACQGRRCEFDPRVRRSPWRRGHGIPLESSCLENSHGRRSLAGLQSRVSQSRPRPGTQVCTSCPFAACSVLSL